MADSLSRLLNIKREEIPLAVLSALFFFCVLCGYYFLRPVRDAMGVSGGMDNLRWLFVVTSTASLIFVLAFGGVVARMNRRRFIPLAYLFIIVCLLGFSALLIVDGFAGGGVIGSDAETRLARGVAYTFFVWLSVINLFSTSVFWAFMVDIFNVGQGKRMFAFIAIGGTLGASLGSSATFTIASLVGDSVFLPAGLMLMGAALFGLAIVVVLNLDRRAVASEHSRLTVGEGSPGTSSSHDGPMEAVGGRFWDGAKAVASSPYILGIGVYIVLMAVSNTLIYFTQANIILNESDNLSQMLARFGVFDTLANLATLFTQLFITTQVIKRIGIGWTLAILPLITTTGFAVLALWPVFGVMAIFQALHRATRYAVSRPSRETLWCAVTPSEKYKAKTVVDVFFYRGGDLMGAGVNGLFAALGLGLAALATATVPLAGVWVLLSVTLGRSQQRRDERSSGEEAQAEVAPVG